ncbi:hypothetical protein [Hyphomicrobium sp.]|uniref:hypothetical protein n=1 Tax=Hyphomicrobium sp. TaxID=82 RepID=UPI001D564020|nr:hypothetical protein [Hyphomicrobium sp.]MBY0559899.1 hypothetical protein [Hyphomicrobium sp.]
MITAPSLRQMMLVLGMLSVVSPAVLYWLRNEAPDEENVLNWLMSLPLSVIFTLNAMVVGGFALIDLSNIMVFAPQ